MAFSYVVRLKVVYVTILGVLFSWRNFVSYQ